MGVSVAAALRCGRAAPIQKCFSRFSRTRWSAHKPEAILPAMNDLTFLLSPPGGPALGAAALNGWVLCLSLIVAIGAQNAFVLRQGLKREHVGLLVTLCSLSDAILIALGVAGLSHLIGDRPWIARALAAAGCVFLLHYGVQALQRAARPQALVASTSREPMSRHAAVLQLAGFTLLNPHVYLDTVLLVGSVGAQQPGPSAQAAFVAGASLASAMWFVLLGYGARWLAPWFAHARAWQVLDALIGLMMLGMVALLVPMALGGH
jgi:L-lysine exporter family protein LysE/ArgO